jgi:hypothetical protein
LAEERKGKKEKKRDSNNWRVKRGKKKGTVASSK